MTSRLARPYGVGTFGTLRSRVIAGQLTRLRKASTQPRRSRYVLGDVVESCRVGLYSNVHCPVAGLLLCQRNQSGMPGTAVLARPFGWDARPRINSAPTTWSMSSLTIKTCFIRSLITTSADRSVWRGDVGSGNAGDRATHFEANAQQDRLAAWHALRRMATRHWWISDGGVPFAWWRSRSRRQTDRFSRVAFYPSDRQQRRAI